MGSQSERKFEVAQHAGEPTTLSPKEPKTFEFGYKTEEQIHEEVVWVPLVKLPGCEIGVSSGNTNRAVGLRDQFTRQVQSKKKYDAGDTPTGSQRLKINNNLVANECLHGVRVIDNHDMTIEHDSLGAYDNTVACRERWLSMLPDFRAEVNQAVADITEKAGEAEEESAKN